jgi:hypothetical protein
MKDGLRVLYDVLTKIMIVMGAMAILVTVLASISSKKLDSTNYNHPPSNIWYSYTSEV